MQASECMHANACMQWMHANEYMQMNACKWMHANEYMQINACINECKQMNACKWMHSLNRFACKCVHTSACNVHACMRACRVSYSWWRRWNNFIAVSFSPNSHAHFASCKQQKYK